MTNSEANNMKADSGDGINPRPTTGDPESQMDMTEAPLSRGGKVEHFFGELSMLLGLDRDNLAALSPRQPFSGPDGMICRIETQQDGSQLVARPQVVLPLDNEEIGRLTVPRVLSLQRTLLSQLGWLLGESSEGLLQLSPLRWTREAQEVARELDLGSAVGRIVLTMLTDEEGADGQAPALPSLPRPSH
jgi:hypothetical protein